MIEVTYIDHMGNDLSVVNAARVSFGKKSEMEGVVSHFPDGIVVDAWGPPKLKAKDDKLIRYLAKHKHISPFGHCFASFHVKAPIFVARQLDEHKLLRWNEISRRYVDDEPEFYVPEVWRGKSEDKKQGSDSSVEPYQGSYEFGDGKEKFTRSAGWMAGAHGKGVNKIAVQTYNALLAEGVAPEQARMVLPQSTMTEWYWSGSLDAFADMCNLCCKSDTQAETRVVAQQIDRKMIELFPVSWDALKEEY